VVRKTQFPRLVIPLAVVLTSLFNLGLNLVAVLVFLLAFGVTPMWTWLLFPLVLLTLIGLTTAVSMIVSSLYPRFRDLAIIWAVASTVLFYASPVLYPLDRVPTPLREVMMVNPLAPLLELARKWIIDPTAPGPAELTSSVLLLLAPVVVYLAVCVLASWLFAREAPRIAEEL
jgi:ABC-2 type transport system permease protein